MRDLLEQRLAASLREIGRSMPDDVVAPVDLQLRVHREQRRMRRSRRWPAVAVAALVVAAVGSAALVRGAAGRGTVRVGAASSAVPVHDALQPGTVMLSAYGHFVVSLDAQGLRNATMVSGRGEITYARATDTHHALWYLSHRGTTSGCGDVVRADIDGRTSRIISRAVVFDVSPDGSRLALYGAGDLPHGDCAPVRAPGTGRVAVVDLATLRSSAVALDDVTSLRWSLDGSSLIAVRCRPDGCAADRIEVPTALGGRLDPRAEPALGAPAGVTEHVEFGLDGVYLLRSSDGASGAAVQTIDRYDAGAPSTPTRLFEGSLQWRLSQVVPTATATYVVARAGERPGPGLISGSGLALYRLVDGRLVLVRAMSGPVTLTAVSPLPGG